MRGALLLALALVGCDDRRSFNERYDDTQRNLEERAQNLDAAVTDGENAREMDSAAATSHD